MMSRFLVSHMYVFRGVFEEGKRTEGKKMRREGEDLQSRAYSMEDDIM